VGFAVFMCAERRVYRCEQGRVRRSDGVIMLD
jgi:hypothetical protein